MTQATSYERVLEFWLGPLDASGRAGDAYAARWWKKSVSFDAEVRERFEADFDAAQKGDREAWLTEPRGRVAYVVVLDQLVRNMYRGTSKMFAGDKLALHAALTGIEQQVDLRLAHDERLFVYMPLMHSESLAIQERGLQAFQRLKDLADPQARKAAELNYQFAVQHRDIIARFGRFPHRNAILGRLSTAEEKQFLAEPGSSF